MEEDTTTVTLLDRQGVQDIIEQMQDMEEGEQLTQNFLFVTCLLAQGQGIEYESFIQLISASWPMAGKITQNV